MTEQNLTNKESYNLKREERQKVSNSAKQKKLFKRVALWCLFVLVLAGSVWGMVKLANKTPDFQGTVVEPVSSSDWIEGNKNSKTVLIEYSDFQCPACGAYYPLIKQLLKEHGDGFLFVYRHFPLQQHKNAKPAAYAAEAAGRQGKFVEMSAMIFENQLSWSNIRNAENTFLEYAGVLNLNLEQFKKDRDSSVVKIRIDDDYKGGARAGVNSTPTFFLNGSKIQPRSYEDFVDLINKANAQNS